MKTRLICKKCGREFERHPFFGLGLCLECITKETFGGKKHD